MVTVVDLARDPAPIRSRTASRTLCSDVNVIVAIPEKEHCNSRKFSGKSVTLNTFLQPVKYRHLT